MSIEIGLVTPPFGLNVYTVKASARGQLELENLFQSVMPFLGIMLLSLALLIAFPPISTLLPSLMQK